MQPPLFSSFEPLTAPVSYQGGKQRLAHQIVDLFWPLIQGRRFMDLCCGSGAVSIELINRGFPAAEMTLVDAGPWGLFWQRIGTGAFDFVAFERYLATMPADLALVKGWLAELAAQPAAVDTAEVFVLLQAGSFGGKAVSITECGAWSTAGFRAYWQPTATSSRRSPVNPMMPMPDTLRRRLDAVASRMRGLTGVHADLSVVPSTADTVVYIDPPYAETTAYGHSVDTPTVIEVAGRWAAAGSSVWVSEGQPLGQDAVLLSSGRAKGGIAGNRQASANAEWLTCFGRTAPAQAA